MTDRAVLNSLTLLEVWKELFLEEELVATRYFSFQFEQCSRTENSIGSIDLKKNLVYQCLPCITYLCDLQFSNGFLKIQIQLRKLLLYTHNPIKMLGE